MLLSIQITNLVTKIENRSCFAFKKINRFGFFIQGREKGGQTLVLRFLSKGLALNARMNEIGADLGTDPHFLTLRKASVFETKPRHSFHTEDINGWAGLTVSRG